MNKVYDTEDSPDEIHDGEEDAGGESSLKVDEDEIELRFWQKVKEVITVNYQ